MARRGMKQQCDETNFLGPAFFLHRVILILR